MISNKIKKGGNHFLDKIVKRYNIEHPGFFYGTRNIKKHHVLLIVYNGVSSFNSDLITVIVYHKLVDYSTIVMRPIDILPFDFDLPINEILYKHSLYEYDETLSLKNHRDTKFKSIIKYNNNIITDELNLLDTKDLMIDYTDRNIKLIDNL